MSVVSNDSSVQANMESLSSRIAIMSLFYFIRFFLNLLIVCIGRSSCRDNVAKFWSMLVEIKTAASVGKDAAAEEEDAMRKEKDSAAEEEDAMRKEKDAVAAAPRTMTLLPRRMTPPLRRKTLLPMRKMPPPKRKTSHLQRPPLWLPQNRRPTTWLLKSRHKKTS